MPEPKFATVTPFPSGGRAGDGGNFYRLGDVLDIRWAVSFHRAGLRDQFIFPSPAGAFPRRLLGGKRHHGNADVRRYRLEWSGWWIDYDEARARAAGNPLPPAGLFAGPKLLIAQNARRIVAALDTDDFICKDTFLVARPLEGSSVPLPYLLGLFNSALLSYLYGVLFNATHVAGGYLHYLSGYLNALPIRLAGDLEPIIRPVCRLLNPDLPNDERRMLDRAIDEVVFDLYGLTSAERALVDRTIAYTWGEGGKRRGEWRGAGDNVL